METVARLAPEGHRCLVLDSDPCAIARCRRLATAGVECLQRRALRIDPARKRVETTDGEAFSYDGRILVAAGAASTDPPDGFVDEASRGAIKLIGHGEV